MPKPQAKTTGEDGKDCADINEKFAKAALGLLRLVVCVVIRIAIRTTITTTLRFEQIRAALPVARLAFRLLRLRLCCTHLPTQLRNLLARGRIRLTAQSERLGEAQPTLSCLSCGRLRRHERGGELE